MLCPGLIASPGPSPRRPHVGEAPPCRTSPWTPGASWAIASPERVVLVLPRLPEPSLNRLGAMPDPIFEREGVITALHAAGAAAERYLATIETDLVRRRGAD